MAVNYITQQKNLYVREYKYYFSITVNEGPHSTVNMWLKNNIVIINNWPVYTSGPKRWITHLPTNIRNRHKDSNKLSKCQISKIVNDDTNAKSAASQKLSKHAKVTAQARKVLVRFAGGCVDFHKNELADFLCQTTSSFLWRYYNK